MVSKKSIVEDELKKVTGGVSSEELDEQEDDIEDNEKGLRILKTKPSHEEMLKELRRREHYEKPTVKRKIITGRIRSKKCR